MKLKNLSKKIRRLEARLQKGAKKLAKLKQKLEAAATTGAAKKTHPAAGKSPSGAKKVKRKLNLTPERRAQLAAAMKARWAARRAAAGANTQNASTESVVTVGDASQPQ